MLWNLYASDVAFTLEGSERNIVFLIKIHVECYYSCEFLCILDTIRL